MVTFYKSCMSRACGQRYEPHQPATNPYRPSSTCEKPILSHMNPNPLRASKIYYKPVMSLGNLLQTCYKHRDMFKVFIPKLLKQLSFS